MTEPVKKKKFVIKKASKIVIKKPGTPASADDAAPPTEVIAKPDPETKPAEKETVAAPPEKKEEPKPEVKPPAPPPPAPPAPKAATKKLDETFKFFCIHCGQKLSAKTGMVGKKTICPTCSKALAIPEPPGVS